MTQENESAWLCGPPWLSSPGCWGRKIFLLDPRSGRFPRVWTMACRSSRATRVGRRRPRMPSQSLVRESKGVRSGIQRSDRLSTGALKELRGALPTTLVQEMERVISGRYWVRTSDLFGVNEARYRCANRPAWPKLAHRFRSGQIRCHGSSRGPIPRGGFPGAAGRRPVGGVDRGRVRRPWARTASLEGRASCPVALPRPVRPARPMVKHLVRSLLTGAGQSLAAFDLCCPDEFAIVVSALRRGKPRESDADVAQLVEHHLAKVRVAGSSPVVRSERPWPHPLTMKLRGGGKLFTRWSGREARQRTANPYTRVQIPSPPRAAGAVVARFPDTEEVTGSNPVSPTMMKTPGSSPGVFIM